MFRTAERLAGHASSLPGANELAETLQYVRSNRSLLEEPDPIGPVKHDLEKALRSALQQGHAHYEATMTAELEKLAAQPVWAALAVEKQGAFLKAAGVVARALPSLGDGAAILLAVEQCDLGAWRTHADAIATKCAQALAAAVKAAEPTARQLTLPNATLRTEAEMNEWLERVRDQVRKALEDGPVIL